jgi:hypothetical protein
VRPATLIISFGVGLLKLTEGGVLSGTSIASNTGALVTPPTALLTTTEYNPASEVITLLIIKVFAAAPKTRELPAKGVPFKSHSYKSGADPVAETVNEAVTELLASTGVGCPRIAGGVAAPNIWDGKANHNRPKKTNITIASFL